MFSLAEPSVESFGSLFVNWNSVSYRPHCFDVIFSCVLDEKHGGAVMVMGMQAANRLGYDIDGPRVKALWGYTSVQETSNPFFFYFPLSACFVILFDFFGYGSFSFVSYFPFTVRLRVPNLEQEN